MNHARPTRGFALVTVIIFATLLCLTAAVLLRYAGTEFSLNLRNQLRFQAKNAAEAMLEYGASQLMTRLERNVNFSTAELRSAPVTVHTARKSTLYAQGASTYNNVAPTALRFWASQYSESTRRYVDPNDPGNGYDPLRGQNVRTQTIRLLASATASTSGLSATQYSTQSVEIRDAFLFNYAIFYNLTMELHPGANMTVSGPVHSNANSYYSTDQTLTFMNNLTTAGRLTVGALATGRPGGRNVFIANGLDVNNDGVSDATISVNSSAIRNASGASLGTYVDSQLAARSPGNTFSQIASQTWRGNLQDSSMGIIPQPLPGIRAGDSVEAHTIIEPPDTSSSAIANLEAQKYSNKAGLYIFQGANSGSAPPAPIAFLSSANAAAYKAQTTAANRAAWIASNRDKVVALPTGLVNPNRRLYDFRESAWVSTVDVDVGKLRTAVASATSGAATNIKVWNSGTASYSDDWSLDATTGGWNGNVYVEVENPMAGYLANSDVGTMGVGTGTRTAVRLVNGTQLPNRREVDPSNALLPDGFTLATNAAAYVCGNYNSPGVQTGDTTTNIGTPKTGEVPAALAADAINILSAAWWNSGLGKPVGDATSNNTTRPAATNTEVVTAILTGNVGTTSGGASYSGGVENFPRFLESWGGIRCRYRGSMVALFNSTVATGPWSSARYGAPTREWGFSQMFQQGRQPPGTPMLRTFRRVAYGDLTATQFNTLLNDTTLGFTSM
jgi:Tfp pilus assembly protein PilX